MSEQVTIPDASNAYITLLQVQALARVLQTSLEGASVELGDLGFGAETMLDVILEKLRMPLEFCDNEAHAKKGAA